MINEPVQEVLDELRELGATVTTGDGYSPAEIAAVEQRLGFEFPEEYREFLRSFGEISLEWRRTWFFYGLDEGLKKTEEYREEFESAAARSQPSREGPYFPRRFFVVYDEGDFANVASGTVFDHDLDGYLVTAGGRWVEASEAVAMGHWGWLIDELLEIRDRLADFDDILVVGSPEPRVVELADVADLRSLHERLASALDFPGYYGHNWDAFMDSMTDLVASEPASRVVFRGYRELESSLPHEARVLRECLVELSAHGLQVLWE